MVFRSYSWKAFKYAEFSDKTMNYVVTHKLGAQIVPNVSSVYMHENITEPGPYDFRTEPYFKNYIRNMQLCGGSWAYSIIGFLIKVLIFLRVFFYK